MTKITIPNDAPFLLQGETTTVEPELYKVIITDNYARETEADREFIYSFPFTKEVAEQICERMNSNTGRYGNDFYKAVPVDYRLSKGMEDLV